MKLSALYIAVFLCLVLAGPIPAQTADADSYGKAGAAYFKAGQFRDSVKAYQQVIRLRPNDAGAYDQLGNAFTRLGMHKEAAEAFEKEADLLTSGNGASVPAPAVAQAAQNTTPREQPQPGAANGQRKYKAGQRVEYVSNGKWYKAVITEVASDADVANFGPYHVYRVHSLGYNEYGDAWASDFADFRAQLRPAGSGPTEPVPGGEASDSVLKVKGRASVAASSQPPAKHYHCVYYVVDHLVDAAPFTITSNSAYTDSDGKRGTYGFDSASSTLTFHGGNYDGQRAEYETSGGLPRLHILGPSGRRVIDCD